MEYWSMTDLNAYMVFYTQKTKQNEKNKGPEKKFTEQTLASAFGGL